ncbi:MAG: shikimate dehydrogenase [Coriobacteriia bacterium]|nr:shikimate dehydrogenase [Coriobacteriia bacterium]
MTKTMISGGTQLSGVVGAPLTHSLSPVMHNAAYQALGLDWVYVPFLIKDVAGLRRFVDAVRTLDVVGFNVTMPFKQEMLGLCDGLSAIAQIAGAVNTVRCQGGMLTGHNTDGPGLLGSLQVEAGFALADTEIVVLGAGGAAASAVAALLSADVVRVSVAARSLGKAEALVARMAEHRGPVELRAYSLDDAEEPVKGAQLIVNATAVGMGGDDESPVPAGWIGEGQVAYDLVYTAPTAGTSAAATATAAGMTTAGTSAADTVPTATAFVRQARAAGARAFDGRGMLVEQGALALEIWTDQKHRAPRDMMRAAVDRALEARRIWSENA